LSGPLLDRLALHVEVTPVPFGDLSVTTPAKSSSEIREAVIAAREIQKERLKELEGLHCNAMLSPSVVKEYCKINKAGQTLLKTAMEKLGLSARAFDRILKVSRTIADLAGKEDILIEHLAEAIQYRSLDREGWAG
jgi:magnesium chelatase family protein